MVVLAGYRVSWAPFSNSIRSSVTLYSRAAGAWISAVFQRVGRVGTGFPVVPPLEAVVTAGNVVVVAAVVVVTTVVDVAGAAVVAPASTTCPPEDARTPEDESSGEDAQPAQAGLPMSKSEAERRDVSWAVPSCHREAASSGSQTFSRPISTTVGNCPPKRPRSASVP